MDLGFLVWLMSISDSIKTFFLIMLIICAITFIICLFIVIDSETGTDTEKPFFSLMKKCAIFLVFIIPIYIVVPNKTTCYQIFAAEISVELYQNSDALKQLPEKSFEAINRLLDSIAKDIDIDNLNKE